MNDAQLRPFTLIGTSQESLVLPLGNGAEVDVGQVTVMLDHRADPAHTNGAIDLSTGRFEASFELQATAPGLYRLVTEQGHDPRAVGPIRARAVWEGRFTEEGKLEATGSVDVLEGTRWAGTQAHTICSGVCGDCGSVQADSPLTEVIDTIRRLDSPGTQDELVYLACPCSFAVTFPSELGGKTATLTMEGVLIYRLVTQPGLMQIQHIGAAAQSA